MALSPYIVTKGVVLRETETRDADKILTLLTAERGKLSVIARGVCRKGCKFAACAQPLAYSEWTLYKKGDWYYANEGATLELFNGLRADLDAMALGFYLAELTEAVTTEDAPHQGLLSHLLNRAVRRFRSAKAFAAGESGVRGQAAVSGRLRASGGRLRLLRLPRSPTAVFRRFAGRSPLRDLRRGAPGSSTVPGFTGRPAAHRLRRPQAALFLHTGTGGPKAAVRCRRSLCLRPVGAGIPDAGLL